jgi:predicted O-methyltransferase YrrM
MDSAGAKLAQAFGYLTQGEVKVLCEVSHNLPHDPVVVNIGAGAGTSSLVMAESRPDARIFTVDISPGGWMGGMENEKNAFRDAGIENRLPTQILSDSQEAGQSWTGEKIDMLIIDADHSYSGCKGDYEAWQKHLRSGGVILFHDYDRKEWPDVRVAVDEAMVEPAWVFVAQGDTYKAFRKA